MVNKHSLGRYLTGFLVLNKDLLLKSGRLTTMGLEIINIKVMQVGKSLAIILQTHSRHTSNIINPLIFQPLTPIWGRGVSIIQSLSQLESPILIYSPLLSINKGIFTAETPISSPLCLLVSFLKQNLNIKFIVDHPKVERLEV